FVSNILMLSIRIRTTWSVSCISRSITLLFFFNDPATTEIYTLSLHDALPIYEPRQVHALSGGSRQHQARERGPRGWRSRGNFRRSEEHTSELQSRGHLVCRLLLEKKKPKSQRNRCEHTRIATSRSLQTIRFAL